jgi:O-succinylbenzoate synthase
LPDADADFGSARVVAIPLRTRFRGITVREAMLIEGPAGWGEFCPFVEYDDVESAPWLATAIEQCTGGWPPPRRARVPVNCIVPAVGAERAHEIVAGSGCRAAKVKVADRPGSLAEDVARVQAVRDALGPGGTVRVDANGVWDVDTAVTHIRRLDRAAGGLEYVEQPCATLEELAAVRRRVDVRIAADESIRRAEDPLRVAVAGAADVAVLKCTPLGGVRRALRVAEAAALPCVVSSALETSVGLAAQLALAGALPQLDFACGLGTVALLAGDVVADADSARPVGGELPVPVAPPAVRPELLDRYRPALPERVRWWRERLARVRAVLEAGAGSS